ncbi:beta 1,3-galactosyltransferase-like [Chamberlinius hualienensis]
MQVSNYLQIIFIILEFTLVRYCYTVEDVASKPKEVTSTDADKIVFVILSQSDSMHAQQAESAQRLLRTQAAQLDWPRIHIYVTHIQWPHEVGIWTVFPLIDKLTSKTFTDKLKDPQWLLICEEGSRVNLKTLLSTLGNLNHEMEWFLGKALTDDEATIVHHFAFHENPTQFKYPDFAAGIVFSWPLLFKLKNRKNAKTMVDELNFSIDPQHELALFVWDDAKGVALTHLPQFCTDDNDQCATYYVLGKIPTCVKPVHLSDIFFAVKTCKKYEERVTVLLETWAKPELDLAFFGDVSNDTHGQTIVNINVENTERGHCGKTMGILHHVANNPRFQPKSWLVITDDDTLLSVPRLRNQLSCYNSMEKIALGQRYGYRTASSEGYDYMTGGAGMVFSMTAVKHIVESGSCKCPTADTPDDMYLGICLQKLKIPIIHSPYFHQARPIDYSRQLLEHQQPVTFHKFWMIDPVDIYNRWLAESPSSSLPSASSSQQSQQHSEL